MLDLVLKIIIAYLVGALMGSLIVGKFAGGGDIREEGSGNAGGTNALRTRGKGFAFWVMLIDVGKGIVAAALVPMLTIPSVESVYDRQWIAAYCGIAAIVGHVWPVYFGFRGGKGMATFLGITGVMSLPALGVVVAVWLLVLVLTGYVGLATMLAAVAVPIYAFTQNGVEGVLFTFGIAMALFIVYTHRSNIKRLLDGSEYCFEKAKLLRRRA